MSLTAADVAEIMRLLEGSSFDEVVLEIDGLKLSMKRGAAAPGSMDAAAAPVAAVTQVEASFAPVVNTSAAAIQRSGASPTNSAAAMPNATSPPKSASVTDPNVRDVISPLLGTCYRAPKPGAAPFVEVGSAVEEDTVVAIVEVMKLMNTVRAGVKGTVSEILMRDGVLVEYGETLLRISKAG